MIGNPKEFVVSDHLGVEKSSFIFIVQKESDNNLSNEILNNLLKAGYTVQLVGNESNIVPSSNNVIITYNLAKGFSSWSMQVIFKRLDIYIYDSNRKIKAIYNWKVRVNKANNVDAVASEFVSHLTSWK